MAPASPQINSEFDPLEKVVVEPPGLNHLVMDPFDLVRFEEIREGKERGLFRVNEDYQLFEDLLYVRQAKKEHEEFRDVLDAVADVVNFTDLMAECLEQQAAVDVVMDYMRRAGEIDSELESELRDMHPPALAEILMIGRMPGERFADRLFPPLPNLMFTRDLSAIVGESVVLSYTKKKARRREMVMARALFRCHPEFRDLSVIDLGRDDEEFSVEGGDVLVASEDIVLLGTSERTGRDSAPKVARELLDRGGFEVVLVVEIPPERRSMHLDTIFTIIGPDHAVVYPPYIERAPDDDPPGLYVYRMETPEDDVGQPTGRTLLGELRELGMELEAIACGGRKHRLTQDREQWSDGSNLLAVAPGIALCYERNDRTLADLQRAGFRVLTSEEFMRNAEYYVSEATDENVVVTLQAAELSRGRGGPRCMSLPLMRRPS